MDTERQQPYDLNRPPHLIANEVLRRINDLLWDCGERFKLEGRFHTIVEQLVIQYQDKLAERDSQP